MKKLTADEVKTFVSEVRSKGSKLPEVDIEKYVLRRCCKCKQIR